MNELYEHQLELTDGMYQSRFLYVHDDCFGRCFRNVKDIKECCMEYTNNVEFKVEITPISINSDKEINVFLLDLIYKEPVEGIYDFTNKNKTFGLINLSDVYYYNPTSCNFNLK